MRRLAALLVTMAHVGLCFVCMTPSAPRQRSLCAAAEEEKSSKSSDSGFAVRLPGTRSGRLVVPTPARLRTLATLAAEELAAVGGARALLERSFAAQRAVGETIFEELTSSSPVKRTTAARFARKVAEKLGPASVKLGQLVAANRASFPEDVASEFEKCLDSTEPVPFSEIRGVVEASLGCNLREVFETFEETPLATASIAQVHAATLRGQRGRAEVAVKVVKPGVERKLKTDLAVLAIAARGLEEVAPELGRVNFADAVLDLKQSVNDEVDLATEAQRLRQFNRFLTQYNLTAIAAAPEPVDALCSANVLTMTLLRGTPLSALPRNSDRVASAVRVWALSVLEGPFFHADLHPANLFALDDGRVGFLDFGVVGSLPPATYAGVVLLARAYDAKDFPKLASALYDLGVASSSKPRPVVVRQLAADLEAVTSKQQQSPAALMTAVVDVAERNELVLPREFGVLVKQALYIAALCDELEFDVLADPRLALVSSSEAARHRHPSVMPPSNSL